MTSVFRTGTKRSQDFANDRERASTKSPLTEFGANKVFVETPRVLSRTDSNPSLTSISAPGQAPQPRRWSQADQTEEEKEEKKRSALQDLVTSWMDRLQLISVITTFFAAMEAQLLGIVTPDPTSNIPKNQLVPSKKASAAALSSALVVHVFAAILSFIAAFFLVRFQLHKATDEEIEAEKRGRAPKVLLSPQSLTPRASAGPAAQPNGAATPRSPKSSTEGGSIHPTASATSQPTPLYYNTTTNYGPRVEQVGPWRKNAPPMRLLQNCHALCVCLAMAGFLFAITGVMTYVWAMLPYSSSIFCAVCLGLCVVASVGAICLP